MKLSGKTALVTGASRGIGEAIALELARQGARRIILVARNPQRLAQVAAQVEAFGGEAVVLPLDLTQVREVSIAIARTWKRYGPIHLLVNCAGVAHQQPFIHSRLSDVQTEIDTNLVGLYTVTRFIARRMVAQREGNIVNVSSLMGKVAAPSMATYSATKFAVVGFSRALRHELAGHNVGVTALLPSLTDTDMVREFAWFRGVVPVSTQVVAQTLVRGLGRNAAEISVGWQARLALWCDRLAPWLLDRVLQVTSPSVY
ncbi:MAG: SDR family NAD(P)-dependent oxidoreductase [Cyanobacteria bacterium P01_A01_bin.135]